MPCWSCFPVISMASHRFTENGVLPAEIKGVIVWVTIQNQNIPKVRIEKSLNPVAMSLILAAAMLLILVAVMLILAVAMSILAVVKNTLFFIKGPGWILGPFFVQACTILKIKVLLPNSWEKGFKDSGIQGFECLFSNYFIRAFVFFQPHRYSSEVLKGFLFNI